MEAKQLVGNVTEPKNLAIIFIVALVYGLMKMYTPPLASLLWVIVTLVGYFAVSAIKKSSSDKLSDTEKTKAVLYMAISPILVQAFYYYRLKKQQSVLAKAFNRLGWNVLGIEIIFGAIIGLAVYFIIGPR